MIEFELGETLYENPLCDEDSIKPFRLEGDATITFPLGRMRLEQAYERDLEQGRHANFVLWCPEAFPDNIAVSWEFRPRSDAGLAMFWCAAAARDGGDLFGPSLQPRDGDYPQYHRGDINALHVSYFRRNPGETEFRTCNLRKSFGFHLVATGADPLPDARHASGAYRVEVVKCGPHFRFSINDLPLFLWTDDGQTVGPVLGAGKIGFRQMAGLIADYANLTVKAVSQREAELGCSTADGRGLRG